MKMVSDAVILELFEGNEVGPDRAGVLQRTGFLPPECLPRRESERQAELRHFNVEGLPIDGRDGEWQRLGLS